MDNITKNLQLVGTFVAIVYASSEELKFKYIEEPVPDNSTVPYWDMRLKISFISGYTFLAKYSKSLLRPTFDGNNDWLAKLFFFDSE